MFETPVKISDTPVIYSSSILKKTSIKERNVLMLISGEKVRMKNDLSISEKIIKFIKSKSSEWFGKEFSYEKIKKSLKPECKINSGTKCILAVYGREIDAGSLHKYLGNKVTFVMSIDKLQISGKDIILKCSIKAIKIYKKEKLESKCMIQDDEIMPSHAQTSSEESDSEDSEVSDDELDCEFSDDEFV